MSDLTVVITIYRVEKYLDKCLKSIRDQSFGNFRALMIVGTGDDECIKICKKYESSDERFETIVSMPRGLSDARNVGIKMTRTQYITFVDGDDCLNTGMFKILMNRIEKDQSDIVIGSYEIMDAKGRKRKPRAHYDSRIYTSEEALKIFLSGHGIQFVVAWGKIYKTKLFELNEIEYPVGCLHEDELTTYKLLYKAGRVSYIDKTCYYYVDRGQSLSHIGTIDDDKIAIDNLNFIKQYIGDFERIKDYYVSYCVSVYVSFIIRASRGNDRTNYQMAKEKLQKVNIQGNSVIRKRMKLLRYFIIHFEKLMFRILKYAG